MKNSLEIIDVTLRDGGYVNSFHFSEDDVQSIVYHLDKARVNYIELGYLKGSPFDIKNCGLTSDITPDLFKRLRALPKQAKLGVMAHPKNVDGEDISRLVDVGLDLIRICITPQNIEQALKLITWSKKQNLKVCANFVRMSRFRLKEVIDNMRLCEESGADIIYSADSLGNMQPKDVTVLIAGMKALLAKNIGFHPHDNLGLAGINALTAIKAGAKIIDGSLLGMGKGGGNLRTEVIAHLLKDNQANLNLDLDIDSLIEAASYVSKYLNKKNNKGGNLFQSYLAMKNMTVEEGDVIYSNALLNHSGSWVERIAESI
ncbi:3-hydroxy-3-methylglutaryl-CoA lyase [Pectobacterium aquaticum]|uniref:3-hydroxy-3-methylglutaryl-CoA lyase n=1 Tax=Pectobacterium aquaticum TaxID=2204145 RepID=UPI000E23A5C0|nr:3-hydroxy-3-methylglutaryl-CoA lyase [Pectobacterium aquaticum]RRO07645.1 3-hydroxy-3-methylglutaryl-CoA lyase [Pectobacterium aquaticum]UEM39397.1 3-hydroxy-3-methylglutaryl-CoA lyase [Pectobacterium aquaticum]